MRSWTEKQRNIIDFTLSSLARRKGKIIALTLAYAFVIFQLASVMFFSHALRREASLVLKSAPEMVVQRMVAGRHDPIPHAYLDAVGEIRGVSSANGRLWGYYFDPVTGATYTFLVPGEFAYGRGEIAIGQAIARLWHASVGDLLTFRRYDGTAGVFTLREILSPESELLLSDLVLLSEQDFREFFDMSPALYTDIVLTVRNASEAPTVAGKVKELLPDTRPIMKGEILQTYDTLFDWRSGIVVVILSSSVLAFIILVLDKASGLSAEEKNEIGILKAIGWETSDVLLLKLWEGTVISLSSFLAGVLLAYLHVFLASAALFTPVLKGWSVLYPEFRLVPFVDPSQVAILFLLAVVPYTVATVVPSWRAAATDPDSVMRS